MTTVSWSVWIPQTGAYVASRTKQDALDLAWALSRPGWKNPEAVPWPHSPAEHAFALGEDT